MNPTDIIRYIVWFATENDIHLTTNRLVKFIYLIDLYHARLKNGQTLTGFPWRFIYYGPYCPEVMHYIDKAERQGLICKETRNSSFTDDKDYNLFFCRDEDVRNLADTFPIVVLGQIQKAIKKFGDDTPQLLDYVYFETEPMEGVRKGDLLDFSKVEQMEPLKKIEFRKLSPETIKLVREKIKKLGDELRADKERLAQDEIDTEKYKDDLYYQFIKLLDGEGLEVGLKGKAEIKSQE